MHVIGAKDKTSDLDEDEQRREDAATIIQRRWRHYSLRKKQLTSNARWKDAIFSAEKKALNNNAQDGNKNDSKSRWQRGVFLAGQIQDGNALMSADEQTAADNKAGHGEEMPEYTKQLETQHWLELVDPKHRYGSNLKYYHQRWTEEDTTDNFFKWLDRGAGKDLTLPGCSREQLESERIIYLSAEQRLNYLVKIDQDGKIRWERNNQLVDTTPGVWVDAGDGKGIIRSDGKDIPHIKPKKEASQASEEQAAKHYHGISDDKDKNVIQRIWRDRFTTSGLMERLLRKTVRKNTWMYVSDTKYNMFVGIKETGYFQHSSFTGGGLVTSAGLIEVKQGLVLKFSPLSGHYRTSTEHYKQFLNAMSERGMDLHKVHVTKGEALLWGMEHWKAVKTAKASGKKKVKGAVDSVFKSRKDDKGKGKASTDGDSAQHEDANSESTEPLTKPEVHNPEDQALRERAEMIRRKTLKQDESWRSGSQWQWEVITGRVQKRMKDDEEKWKSAMEKDKSAEETGTNQPEPSTSADVPPFNQDLVSITKNPEDTPNLEHRLDVETPASKQVDTPEDSPPAYVDQNNAQPSTEKVAE